MVEEDDLVDDFFVGRSVETLAALSVPNHQHISTLKVMYLSSRQPREASSLESGEKARLVTAFLCNLSLCLISLFSKFQMMTSAICPGKECSAEAMNFPSLDILMAE